MKTRTRRPRPSASTLEPRPERARRAPRVQVRCAYCHDDLPEEARRFCASCLTPHHAECWLDHGSCSAPGCGGTRTVRSERPDAPPRKRGQDAKRPRERERRRRPGRGSEVELKLANQANYALALGVAAMVLCGLAGPFAIVEGRAAQRLAERNRLPVPGAATVGLVCGWVATIGLSLALTLFVVRLGALVALA